MVRRRGALSEVASLQKNINQLFEQLVQVQGTENMTGIGEWFPSVDVVESDKTVVVTMEAPGLGPEELKVSIRGAKIMIVGEKRQNNDGPAALGYLCMERSFGKFSRSVYIDQAVDFTRARAELDRGTLSISLPKLRDRRGSEIQLPIEAPETSERTGKTAAFPPDGVNET